MRSLIWAAALATYVQAGIVQTQSSSSPLLPADTTIVSPTTTSTLSSTTSALPTVTSIVTTSVSSILTVTTTSTITSIVTAVSTVTSSSTTTSSNPIVTDEAYIDTVLRHHNRHRANHTADALTWNDTLAMTAKKIADSCVYQHDTTTDGGGYGQNIAAGFQINQMGSMISDGFYNTEVDSYTAYGQEPDYNDVDSWGHFTQVVWNSTTTVGCFTTDCSATGITYPEGGGENIPPFFTVCNYSPAGNYVQEFATHLSPPLGFPIIHAGYECPTSTNCVGPQT